MLRRSKIRGLGQSSGSWRPIVLLIALALLASSCGDGDEQVDPDPDPDPRTSDDDYLVEVAGPVGQSDAMVDESLCRDAEYGVVRSRYRGLVVGEEARDQVAAVLGEEALEPTFGRGVDGELNLYVIEDAYMEGRIRQELAEIEQIHPVHFFSMHPIHRGHPVDSLIAPPPADGYQVEPLSSPPEDPIAVVDVDPASGVVHAEHGPFILSIIEQMGASGEQFDMEALPGGDDALFFDEIEVIRALDQVAEAAANGASFSAVNLSFGGYGCEAHSPGALAAVTAQLDIPVVASAGNDGTDQPVYPAAFDHVVGVGSVTGDLSARSCFSNYGDWVTAWMPGQEVVALLNGTRYSWSGTSFAAPQVAVLDPVTAGGTAPVPSNVDPSPDPEYGC